jgi:hypothetical protein
MKFDVSIQLNLTTANVGNAVVSAAERAMRDTVVAVAADAVRLSPAVTSHNRRSIDYKAEGLKGSVFSTSGYGGYIEVGTGIFGPRGTMITPKTARMLVWEGKGGELIFAKAVKGMPARPYMKPALDKSFTVEKFAKRVKDNLR